LAQSTATPGKEPGARPESTFGCVVGAQTKLDIA